jgi:Tol biopolymer transport system component
MSDVAPSSSPKAVFLSYTSDDMAVALAVCEALRESGIEVWMDRSELQGGDAWDANIQRQIRECALIIPIISKRTQARREGYFRLEWRLADERMRLVADGTPLILPVAADETREQDALVPKSFLTVQWSRLPHGHVPPAFVARVRKLLGLESAVAKTAPSFGVPPIPKEDSLAAFDAPATVQPMSEAGGESGSSRRSLVPFAAAILGVLVGGIAIWFLKPAPKVEPSQVALKPVGRFAHELPASVSFSAARGLVAISPDGRSFAYSTSAGIFIRKMDEMEARVIPGTESSNAGNPVYSPDSQSLVFYARNELRKMSLGGRGSVAIAPAASLYGISWGRDGSILFSQADGIWRINSAGAAPEKIVPTGEGEFFSDPQLLPDGKSVLFSCLQNSGLLQVEVSTLPDKKRKVVVSGGASGRFLPSTGHLLYSVNSDVFGIAFDPQRGVTRGTAVPLLQGVRGTISALSSYLAVADDGTLLYLGENRARMTVPVWVDRHGKEERLKIDPEQYQSFALSPDDTKVALGLAGNNGFGLVVWDFVGETRTRLTLGATGGNYPIWSLDGSRIIYDSRDGKISAKPVNNTRAPEIVVEALESRAGRLNPSFITPDGRSLVFDANSDIGMISFDGKGPVTWLFKSAQFLERGAALSPDGKWIAYTSDESGRGEVYVSPFPGIDQDRVLISNAGGSRHLWSRDGKELFYVGGLTPETQRLMSAPVSSEGGKFAVAARSPVWSGTLQSLRYAVAGGLSPIGISRDNQRFLVLKHATEDDTDRIHIVLNWTEELKRRVPGFLP